MVSLLKGIPKSYEDEVCEAINHNYKLLVKANMAPKPLFTSIPMTEEQLKCDWSMTQIYSIVKDLRTQTNRGRKVPEGVNPKKGVCWDFPHKTNRMFVQNFCVYHLFHDLNGDHGIGWVNGADEFVDLDDEFLMFKQKDEELVDVEKMKRFL